MARLKRIVTRLKSFVPGLRKKIARIKSVDNGDGTFDCLMTVPGCGKYCLVVPDVSDGYFDIIRESGGLTDVAQLLLNLVKPDHVVFDLGANIGTVSIPLAVKGARVYAFEALPQNLALIDRASTKNRLTGLTIVPRAAWDRREKLRFSGYGAWGMINQAGETVVEAISLDEFVKDNKVARVHLIKIDIEGSELKALQGMQSVLANWAPDLVFEANVLTCGQAGYSIHELFAFFKSLDYGIYRLQGGTLIPFNVNNAQEMVVCDYLASRHSIAQITRDTSLPVKAANLQVVVDLMRAQAHVGAIYSRYMALRSDDLPIELQQNRDLAPLLKIWANEPLDEATIAALLIGSSKL